MKNRNCPNCGAPFELDKIKCEHCGTLYLDMGCLDLAEGTPVFIRYRVPFNKKTNSICFNSDDYAYVTQCAIPRLGDISFSNDTVDCIGWGGSVITSYCSNRHMSTNLTFDAIPFGESKSLCMIQPC